MSEEPLIPIPAEEPRYCPQCGARVAARATTCLMCGAALVEEKVEEKPPPRARFRWLFWLAVVGAVALVGGVGSTLLRPHLFPTPTPIPTTPPTTTATPTATGTPTPTPTITPTPTPLPPRAHQVQPGETLASIAALYETTVEEILALNPGITPELLQVGQVLLIPPAEPTPGSASAEDIQEITPTLGDFIVHTVAPGETLLSIAQKYSVTVALIRAANPGLPPGLDVLRVNQTLVIPMGTPMPTPTPTVNPYATPTPIPPYPPPPLLSPPNGAVFGGPDAVIVLQWASVGILHTGEWYEVRLIRPEAPVEVARTRTTAYRVPAEFFPPPEQTNREFRWEVRVVREQIGTDEYAWVSEPGPSRIFLWLAEAPTPTPSPTVPSTPTP